jgi:TRAP-type mannitol/chloroaromatic compound transport system permease small subunit
MQNAMTNGPKPEQRTQTIPKHQANTIVRFFDNLSEVAGQLTAWMVIAMVGLTLYDVAMRYVFRDGSVALQELEWHFFALVILFGAAYTFKYGEHVRVDLIYSSPYLPERYRQVVDILGNLVFLLPFAIMIIWTSIPFAYDAFIHREISPDPGGLSNRWIIKASIPTGFALLAVQAIADTVKRLAEVRRAA